MPKKIVLDQKQLNKLIINYQDGISLKKLEKQFRISKERIKKILKENGIKVREYNKNYKFVEKGTKFNQLTYIKKIKERKNKKIMWLVKCDCGNEKVVYKFDVTTGKTKSCGCLKNKSRIKIRNREDIIVKLLFGEYRKSAKVRGYDFNIDIDYFKELITSDECFYCKSNDKKQRKDEITGFIMHYMGIDRLINNKGYKKGNVVSCCTTCNYMKRDMDINKFLELVNKIHNNRGKLAQKADQLTW